MSARVRFRSNPDIFSYQESYPILPKITRSATVATMVTSSVVKSIRITEPVSLSVDDICSLADRERLCYSARGRRQALENAQKQTYKIDDTVRSRPHTSASRYIRSVRRETMTPKSLRSEPVPTRVSSRTGNDFDDDDDDDFPINIVTSPSPLCCEIIGPQACEECLKIYRRRVDREKSAARFPNIRVSNQNITTTAVLQRYFPTLSTEEIQFKLRRGEIARSPIPRKPQHKSSSEHEIKRNKDSLGLRRAKQDLKKMHFESMFFVNIQDLNHRINSGQVSRSLGFTCKSVPTRPRQSLTEGVFPSFVSPRKVKFIRESSGKQFHYEPPLLPKENQKPEPNFFAGSDQKYELPERLPDQIEFVENEPVQRSLSIVSDAFSEFSHLQDNSVDQSDSKQNQTDISDTQSEIPNESFPEVSSDKLDEQLSDRSEGDGRNDSQYLIQDEVGTEPSDELSDSASEQHAIAKT